MTEQPDLVTSMAAAADAVEPIVAAVRPDQWALPSPCTEWDVRGVVEHLVRNTDGFLAAVSGGGASPAEPVASVPDAGLAAAFAASNARLLAVLREPGALERTLPLPSGEMPAAVAAGFGLVDLLVHGWDVAKATGQPTDFAPELNEAALAMTRQAMSAFDRSTMTAFAPEQPAPDDASAADRLAAFLGRAV